MGLALAFSLDVLVFDDAGITAFTIASFVAAPLDTAKQNIICAIQKLNLVKFSLD